MNIETLHYKLTGLENPKHLNMREKLIIAKCLEIINETEQLNKPVVVRGGDSETESVSRTQNVYNSLNENKTPNTPTEPLPREGEVTEG